MLSVLTPDIIFDTKPIGNYWIGRGKINYIILHLSTTSLPSYKETVMLQNNKLCEIGFIGISVVDAKTQQAAMNLVKTTTALYGPSTMH